MCAKLLEFYTVSLNKERVIYFPMTKDENGKVHPPFEFHYGYNTPADVMGIIFGAQSSLTTRKSTNTKLYNPGGIL